MPQEDNLINQHRALSELFNQMDVQGSLEEILHAVPDALMVQNENRKIVFANAAAAELMGFTSPKELLNMQTLEVVDRFEVFDENGQLLNFDQLPARYVLNGEEEKTLILLSRNKQTDLKRWSEVRAQAVRDRTGHVRFAVSLFRDITKRKDIEAEYERINRRNQHILESITDGFFALDKDWKFAYVNKQAEKLFLKPKEELVGKNIFEVFPQAISTETYKQAQLALSRNEAIRFEEYFPDSGQWIETSAYPAKDGLAVYLREITSQKKSEERLRHQYYHDSLTGLPNRTFLTEQLSVSISDAEEGRRSVALILIDLDRFKQINESLGHAVGDRLIQEVALRLRACLKDQELLARLGGDEFAILLPGIDNEEGVAKLSVKILDDFKPAFYVDEYELFVTPSIGVSLYPFDGRQASELFKNSETALYRAKDHGRNTYQFYATTMNSSAYERLTMESRLRHAIDNNELVLFYQPQIDVTTGKIVGAEELIRWQRPDQSLIPPDRFIPLAEANGLIEPIGVFVLQESLRQAKIWHETGYKLMIAINLSPRQFKQKNFEHILVNLIEESRLDPKYIELELTESVLAENPETVFQIMNALRERGVRFCLDDFSTGYSSLKYIKQFPVDMLKIERNFLKGIPLDVQNCAIAKSIITLGQSLGMEVTAEGVESKKQLAFLRDNLCNRAQGYLFNGAMPAHSLSEILSEDRYTSVITKLKNP